MCMSQQVLLSLWHCGSVETLTSWSHISPKLNPLPPTTTTHGAEKEFAPDLSGAERESWPGQIKLPVSLPSFSDTDLLSDCSEYMSWMPSRRIPPNAFFSIVGFIYIFKRLFFVFGCHGLFSILLHSIAHNLTNVKCAAAWLVQPFIHEPGRYRARFQQKHDMQLKYRGNPNCSLYNAEVFPPVEHAGCLYLSHRRRPNATCANVPLRWPQFAFSEGKNKRHC